ncbi:MAG: glycoside hydrolase family 37 [Rhodospirillaceae bacterium]|nr:glycoside hydrolase family 37 [Rhodospirillaceae bacterium]
MSETTIQPDWAWNSWASEWPVQMTYLPLGLTVTPCAYAASRNAFTDFPAGDAGIRLGPRAVRGEAITLELEHAGTRLSLRYDKPDPFTLCGAWRTQRTGEWGLRFWVLLCFRLMPPDEPGRLVPWRYDPQTGTLSTRHGAAEIVALGERPPLLATFHDSLAALRTEYETKGYFCLDSRGERGPVAVLRYNLEEMATFRFTVTVGNDGARAHARAAAVLGLPSAPAAPAAAPALEVLPPPRLPAQQGRYAGALDAVRDVLGWNTVWDPVNRRPYTSLSRNWVAQKFGGWGVWLNDVLYHALMASLVDPALARHNLRAVLAGATAEGNLPCLLTGRDSWIDRSQPPIGAYIAWLIHLRTGARDLLDLVYPVLLRNHEWWWRVRDGNGDGLVEYGTSPIGHGLYRGTKLAAKDESSMDNAPIHDEARLDRARWTLDCADVGLNSLLALDGEMLAAMARVLGDEAAATHLEGRTAALRERIATRLWDPERRVFANRLWSGAFVRSLAPTSFYPLLAGAASGEQAAAMAALIDERESFGGEWLLPSVERRDPAFDDNVYWRGRIWPPLNFLTYQGLRRSGLDAAAARLAESSYALFMREWEAHRRCPENFNAVTGAAADQPDTDLFYGWGALMPLIAVAEVSDVSPWGGWEVTNGEAPVRLGPLVTPAGAAVITARDGILTIAVAGRPALRTNLAGRIRRLRIESAVVGMVLPPDRDRAAWVELPGLAPGRVAAARLGGRPVDVQASGDGSRLLLPAGRDAAALEVFISAGGPP